MQQFYQFCLQTLQSKYFQSKCSSGPHHIQLLMTSFDIPMVVLARRPSIFFSSFNHTYERFLSSNTFQCVKTIHTVYNKDVDFDDFESFFSLPHSDSYCSNSRYMIKTYKSSSFYPVAIRYFDTSLFYAVSYTSSPPNLRSKQSK